MKDMKIVAGIGAIDDYEAFVQAGADELFAGYQPLDYMLKAGRNKPVNRREVIYYNVQIGSESELLILKKMIEDYGIDVSITFNEICLSDETRKDIKGIIERCIGLGFRHFIIADLELIDFLKEYDDIFIEVSGELSEMNSHLVKLLAQKKVSRIIFPRQTTINEMRKLTEAADNLEYEAFVLNEKCHFTGAYCNSLHCDELCHMCKVPYKLSPEKYKEDDSYDNIDTIGSTGCGLCALWDLKDAGISHLKIVSRGNSSENTVKDINALRKALYLLVDSSSREDYISKMKDLLFPKGCSHNCYYLN